MVWPPKQIDIQVTNRKNIKTLTFDKPYMLISIRDRGSEPVILPVDLNRRAVLFIAFDDATPKERIVAKPLLKREARIIWRFFDTYIGCAELLVVQCEAGVSRSAAVAAALLQYSGRDDRYCYQPRFHLNYYVKKVMGKVREQGTIFVGNDEKDMISPIWNY